MISPQEINRAFGNIDLFLLDQLLKGRFDDKRTLLDAGCGEGRNLKYFINAGYDVFGIDNNEEAIKLATMIHKKGSFHLSDIHEAPFPEKSFDCIICINVLHHSASQELFIKSFEVLGSLLSEGGILMIRTLLHEEDAEFIVKDGFLICSKAHLENLIDEFQLNLVEPVKMELFDSNKLGIIIIGKD